MDLQGLGKNPFSVGHVRALTTPLAPPPGTQQLGQQGTSVLGTDKAKVSGGGGGGAVTACSCGLATTCDGSHTKLATLAGGEASPQVLLKMLQAAGAPEDA